MYWYKIKLPQIFVTIVGGIFLCLLNITCKPNVNQNGTALKYFDLKGYFANEAARLTKQNKPVLKTITYNKNVETKDVFISDWARELDFFSSSDINKPAWKDSYDIESSDNFLIYKTKDKTLKVWELIVKKDGPKVKWVLIYTYTKNLLYQTREKLTYFPDSLYLIEKKQSVRILGNNVYKIRGVFNH